MPPTDRRPSAVVTGGGGGIGRAAAERFLRDGYTVVVGDLNGVRRVIEESHPPGWVAQEEVERLVPLDDAVLKDLHLERLLVVTWPEGEVTVLREVIAGTRVTVER